MPDAPQPIDWPGLRANAVTMGIRPAARAAAANLPPDEAARFEERVAKRATREGWEVKRLAVIASSAGRQQGPTMPLSTNVHHGQDAAINTQAEDERETRMSHSRIARKLARQAESSKIVIQTPADVLALVKHYAVTHRIDQDKGGPRLVLNQFNVQLGIEPPVTDI